MAVLTVSLFVVGFGFRGQTDRINRLEGAILLACYVGYTTYLVNSVLLNGCLKIGSGLKKVHGIQMPLSRTRGSCFKRS